MSAQPQDIPTPAMQFREYVEHGYSIVPIPPGLKGPRTKGWNLRENRISRVEDVPATLKQAGLAHLYSNTCAFDLDDLEKARDHFRKSGIDLDALLNAEDAVRIDSGKPNRGKLLFTVDPEVATRLFHDDQQELGYELRCCARPDDYGRINTIQDVLPPSIHPDTKQQYRWTGKGDWRSPPMLPQALQEYWLNVLDNPPENNGASKTGRNNILSRRAFAMRKNGVEVAHIEEQLLCLNIELFPNNPLPDKEVIEIARKKQRIPPEIPLNDLGNAQRLVADIGEDIRHIADLGMDMTWSDQGWIKDRRNSLHRAFVDMTIPRMLSEAITLDTKQGVPLLRHAKASGNTSKIKGAVDLARKESPIRTLSDQWDANGDWIAFWDGTVLNVRTMESRPMTRDDLIRRRINAPFDLNANCREFSYLIDHLVGGDEDARRWLLQLWSTGLSSSILQKIIFVLWGASDSGKTTAVEIVKRVLGDFAVSLQSNFILKKKYPNSGGPNAELIDLLGKRAAFVAEFPSGRLDDNLLKNLTGSDTLPARRLYSNEIVQVPCRLTITISSNGKPFFDATDAGMLTRARALHVREGLDFSNKPMRSNAVDWIVQREASGIVALLVRSLRELIENDEALPESQRIDEDTAELNLANDRVAMFIKHCCDTGPDKKRLKSKVHEDYVKFCESEGHQPFSKRRFYEVMRDVHGFAEKRIRGYDYFAGIEERVF